MRFQTLLCFQSKFALNYRITVQFLICCAIAKFSSQRNRVIFRIRSFTGLILSLLL